MKTILKKSVSLFVGLLAVASVFAQDNTEAQQEAFDKKFRFGLRVNPELSWIKSSDKSASGGGASFAFGFGLMTEIRLSKIIGILTGIGGEFEKYKVNYRADADVSSILVLDKDDNYVEAKDGLSQEQFNMMDGRSQFILKARTIRTTFVNIPLQFKMNTQEFNGIRYFGIFGADIALRTKILTDDEYASGVKAVASGTSITTTALSGGELSRGKINLSKDASLLPFRLGLNIGAGMEYRLASTTSLFVSLNYFMGFTNLLKNESKFLYKGKESVYDASTGKYDFVPVKQSLIPYAFKLNVGIFF